MFKVDVEEINVWICTKAPSFSFWRSPACRTGRDKRMRPGMILYRGREEFH
jgi:hypothetical protein